MSPVGHGLTGIAIAAAVASPEWRRKEWCLALPVFIVLANVPDLPVDGWGHDCYEVSHSLFVTGCGTGLLFLLFLLSRACPADLQISLRVALAACVAWFSHLFLDSLYGHGKGIRVMWPFGEGRLNFPVPWFETLETPVDWISIHSARVFAIEFACFAPITIACLILARRRCRALRL